jgi:septal ring factor EnvC (AmiA/AmiB activator)
MLNWRRDPGYEQRKIQHEWRMKQLENDILRVRRDRERIENDILQVRNDSERIEKETEQLRQETEQLRQQNSKGRQLLASIDALCFPPESSSIPPNPIEPGSKPSLPS